VKIPNAIPFLDLVTPHVELEPELTAVFQKALRTAGFVGGPMVEEFEKAFAAFCGSQHSIAVSSGTDAVRPSLIACGVRPGDVVLTVPHTFIATTEAISQAGALPEFVDIDEQTYNIDPEKLRDYLETQCRISADTLVSKRSNRPVTAIVPVHLYGQMADMDPILELAERYRLVVIEDACQAHGAEYFSSNQNRWFKAGTMGSAAAFSFYPGKNLGACGEGGAVTTQSSHLTDIIKMIRDHGQAKKYYHDLEGYNKFVPYYLHPESIYSVGLSKSSFRVKVSVGSNPWAPSEPTVNLAKVCERYGGGGHARVGAISFDVTKGDAARKAAQEIVEELRASVKE
jgi:dTDP-4-amino-4,6-dideoxygalactose transaminase